MTVGSSRHVFSEFFQTKRVKGASYFPIIKTKVLCLLGLGLSLNLKAITIAKVCSTLIRQTESLVQFESLRSEAVLLEVHD